MGAHSMQIPLATPHTMMPQISIHVVQKRDLQYHISYAAKQDWQ